MLEQSNMTLEGASLLLYLLGFIVGSLGFLRVFLFFIFGYGLLSIFYQFVTAHH